MEKKPTKIVVVCPLEVGGVGNMMINIQRHLNREVFNFDYLVLHDQKEAQEDTVFALGSEKIIVTADDIPLRLLRPFVRIGRFKKVCREKGIKVMHFNVDSALSLTNILGARLGGVKYVTIHIHTAGFVDASFLSKLSHYALRPFMPLLCDRFWACSHKAAEFAFPASVVKNKRYEVLPNGIELDKFDYREEVRRRVRRELGVEGKFVVGHVGRFTEAKNHMFLIDLFKALREKDSNAVLVLFGVGELMEQVKEKVAREGLADSVIFYGVSDRIYDMWQGMDVFVMPSIFEGLPVAGVEAQVSGLPCVFSTCVTKEVDLTGEPVFLDLEAPMEQWVEAVLAAKNQPRISHIETIRKANYDIQQTADTLTEVYLEASRKL
ncbi:MAG: glycosyltransferase [Oscillospiraceae bacterium]|nr:glycosyltransferase [Oscillospiraceae bacterium]